MTDGLMALACLVLYASGPSLVARANRAINGLLIHAVEHHLLSVVQALSRDYNDWVPLNPVLANGHSLKRTPSKPLCLPENLTLKYTPL